MYGRVLEYSICSMDISHRTNCPHTMALQGRRFLFLNLVLRKPVVHFHSNWPRPGSLSSAFACLDFHFYRDGGSAPHKPQGWGVGRQPLTSYLYGHGSRPGKLFFGIFDSCFFFLSGLRVSSPSFSPKAGIRAAKPLKSQHVPSHPLRRILIAIALRSSNLVQTLCPSEAGGAARPSRSQMV